MVTARGRRAVTPVPVGYAAEVIALLLLAVAAFVWIRRGFVLRREARHRASEERSDIETTEREREIIAEMERNFHRS